MSPAAGLARYADGTTRCWWPGDDPLYQQYHDGEWGTPVKDAAALAAGISKHHIGSRSGDIAIQPVSSVSKTCSASVCKGCACPDIRGLQNQTQRLGSTTAGLDSVSVYAWGNVCGIDGHHA